jgi:hypothetical protein
MKPTVTIKIGDTKSKIVRNVHSACLKAGHRTDAKLMSAIGKHGGMLDVLNCILGFVNVEVNGKVIAA